MKEITTKDNSITFHNEEFDETYHSISGAIEESIEKFARPANIKPGNKILDICFGLGYNSMAALQFNKNIQITALESDKEIINKIKEIHMPKEFKESYSIVQKTARGEKTQIKLIIGDARKTIKDLEQKFDIVFLDPFSPKKCPELWTEKFFKDITKVMKKGGILTTYSCAKLVRQNLIAAGFKVKDGPSVGRRAPSTIAVFNG